ncbi:MAG TPA: carbohydrate ABC transporter permease [Chloroflexota bacterium]|nr:carbohydrate ABC transporter permease [Chloroflexota bacterium]
MLFPFYWMLTTALKGLEEASAFPPTLWPTVWMWDNFGRAWQAAPFGRYLLNTVVVATGQTASVLVTGSLAAYAFARIPFPGKNLLFICFLGTMMIPVEVLLVPDFIILKNLGWYDTYLALIVPWMTSVFAIFLLRQFFLSIPDELWDAAQIDGCGRFGFLWRVAVPMARPGLITVGLLTFHGAWNALLWPLIVTGSPNMRLLQVGLAAFQSDARVQYHLWMAAATLTMAPMLAIFLFAQRYFIDAASRSGLKG